MQSMRPLLLLVLAIPSGGCGQWSWNPSKWFAEPPAAGQPPAQVLAIESTTVGGGERFVQTWDGARLIVDVHTAGSGSAVLKPAPEQSWPLKLAFRVHSGRLAEFEARGAQSVRLSFGAASFPEPALIDLPYGVYVRDSPQLGIRWLDRAP